MLTRADAGSGSSFASGGSVDRGTRMSDSDACGGAAEPPAPLPAVAVRPGTEPAAPGAGAPNTAEGAAEGAAERPPRLLSPSCEGVRRSRGTCGGRLGEPWRECACGRRQDTDNP